MVLFSSYLTACFPKFHLHVNRRNEVNQKGAWFGIRLRPPPTRHCELPVPFAFSQARSVSATSLPDSGQAVFINFRGGRRLALRGAQLTVKARAPGFATELPYSLASLLRDYCQSWLLVLLTPFITEGVKKGVTKVKGLCWRTKIESQVKLVERRAKSETAARSPNRPVVRKLFRTRLTPRVVKDFLRVRSGPETTGNRVMAVLLLRSAV